MDGDPRESGEGQHQSNNASPRRRRSQAYRRDPCRCRRSAGPRPFGEGGDPEDATVEAPRGARETRRRPAVVAPPVDWAAMTGWLPRAWQQPMAVLLVVQLTGVLLYPFMDESALGRAALSTFGLVVLFLAVRAVRATPALTWIAVLLGLPLIVLTILEAVDPLNTQIVLW